MKKTLLLFSVLLTVSSALFADAPWRFSRDWFADKAGKASVIVDWDGVVLLNDCVRYAVQAYDGKARPKAFNDMLNGRNYFFFDDYDTELFRVKLGGNQVNASDCLLEKITRKGNTVLLRFSAARSRLNVTVALSLEEDANYIHGKITAESAGEAIEEIVALDLPIFGPDASVRGTVPGSPVIVGSVFAAVEHPLAEMAVKEKGFSGKVILPEGTKQAEVSFALGMTVKGQQRRSFQFYVERERARPETMHARGAPWQTVTVNGVMVKATTDALNGSKEEDKTPVAVDAWPSPFWLWSFDAVALKMPETTEAAQSIDGSLSARDEAIYTQVIAQEPLYPLGLLTAKDPVTVADSTALGGKLYALLAFGSVKTAEDAGDAVKAAIADATAWVKRREAVLRDLHWLGGQPSAGAVYGYAAWSPEAGVIILRNPSDKQQSYALKIGDVLELPDHAPVTWTLTSPLQGAEGQEAIEANAGKAVEIALKPFEVLVFDAAPLAESGEYYYTVYGKKDERLGESRADYVGRWQYVVGEVTLLREFRRDGTIVMAERDAQDSWDGFTWDVINEILVIYNKNGTVADRQKLSDKDTLDSVSGAHGTAKRVKESKQAE